MNAIDPNPRAIMGANLPPSDRTPFDVVKDKLVDLHMEAKNWLDGAPVDTAELAAGVEKLEVDLKAAIKAANAERDTEYRPHNEAKTAIQSKYDPLIGGSKCDGGIGGSALSSCKAALTPWRIKVQAEKDAAAAAARKAADAKIAEAIAAHKAADASNLAETEAANALLEASAKAQRIAKAAEKATTTKTGLRTTYHAVMLAGGLQDAARHIWTNDQDALAAFVQSWADNTVRSFGANAEGLAIPGFEIVKQQESR